ncbi:ATP-binding protein [Bifidobacterium sp. SO4]|uniref:ATP-binding protein n=1 Tax=Bifidobacterium sp. SO4 TaxID=2809030 RepID=UPI001BDC34B4|nr:ATP-binding protein [Bifidobacterium sp. SO4]MBT1170744.1 Crp/Fnr family transcriptional regulator [Bifidobacterium sp. SO4]
MGTKSHESNQQPANQDVPDQTTSEPTDSLQSMLLSDQCPFMTKVIMFDGDAKTTIRERRTFTGSLLKQLDEAGAMLNRANGDGRFPAVAVREALVNALEHRDYGYSGPTIVNVFDSRLEIISLGGLAAGLEINDLLNGVSQPRYPALAERLANLGLCEDCGAGVQRIMDAYADQPVSPQLRVGPTSVALVLPSLVPAGSGPSPDGQRTNGTAGERQDAPAEGDTSDAHTNVLRFPTIQRMTDQASEALTGARVIGCAPMQILVLGRGFDTELLGMAAEATDTGESQSALDVKLMDQSNEALEQATLNLISGSGVPMSRQSIQNQMQLSKDKANLILRRLVHDGKVVRSGKSRATTYSAAEAGQ